MKVTIEVELDDPSTEQVKDIFGAVNERQTTVDDWKATDDPADTDEQESADDPSDDADDDADNADEPETLDARLKPGTWKFKVASTLFHVGDDKLSASDVEDALDGTEWKHKNPQNISRDLKTLVDEDIATREKVETDSGHDYFQFWLTPAGERLVESVEADDDVTTYGDVADRGLGALFNGTETEPNGGEA